MATLPFNSSRYALNRSALLKKLIPIIFIGLIINIFFSFAWRDSDLLVMMANFSPTYFALAVALVILPWVANAMRLFIWIRFFGSHLSYTETFRIVVLSELGAAITPSAVGSGPVKIGLLVQENLPTGAALSIATLTTLEDVAFFVPAIPLALTLTASWHMPIIDVFRERLQANLGGLGIIIAGLVVFILLVTRFWSKIHIDQAETPTSARISFLERMIVHGKQILGEFKTSLGLIGQHGKIRFFATTLLSGIQWICRYSIITALAASLGIKADPILFFVLQWIVFTVSVFVPTPGAIGGAEASFLLIFAPFLPQESLGLIMAGWRLLTFYLFLTSGVAVYGVLRLILLIKRKSVAPAELVCVE